MSGKDKLCSEQNKHRKKSPTTKILAVLLAIAIAVIVFLLIQAGIKNSPDSNVIKPTKKVDKLTDSIDIPGFGDLQFQEGQLNQELIIPNPAQNFCWFKVALLLEDDTILWTSDLIAPGEQSDSVTLTKPLEKGEYRNAKLKFQCFSDENGEKSLNGAETKLNIIVQ